MLSVLQVQTDRTSETNRAELMTVSSRSLLDLSNRKRSACKLPFFWAAQCSDSGDGFQWITCLLASLLVTLQSVRWGAVKSCELSANQPRLVLMIPSHAGGRTPTEAGVTFLHDSGRYRRSLGGRVSVQRRFEKRRHASQGNK